ncbi:MAG: hypothetical protein ACREMH_07845 [Gemmatimonadales bacterium]
MSWMRSAIPILALIQGGWLAFDGLHAFTRGDYVTPRSGAHDGQLGPWAQVVSAVGIEPRSTLMRSVHVLLGAAWLVAAVGFLLRASWSRRALLLSAIASMWYLPFGTMMSLAVLILLTRATLRTSSGSQRADLP